MKRRIVMVLVAGILVGSASAGLADEKKDHICFRTLDADKDGRVTFQEFEKSYGSDPTPFKAADTDQDGVLTHDEYHGLLGGGAR